MDTETDFVFQGYSLCMYHANQFAKEELSASDLSVLTGDHEIALMQRLSEFPEIVEAAGQELAPHIVATYLRDLAADLHSFYNDNKILVDDDVIKLARLALINATRQVLHNGLSLLGVSAPEKM